MNSGSKIAVVCDYSLKPERIGGMDRFFVAYDKACKERGCQVDWYFSESVTHKFYEGMSIHTEKEMSAEKVFLQKNSQDIGYEVIVTHFVELCTPFFQSIKNTKTPYIIAVDHNPRPLKGFSYKKRLRNKIYGLLYSKFIDKFISVSQYSQNALLKDFGSILRKKIVVVHNGIKLNIYRQKTKYQIPARSFIVTSHLRKEKGIQDVIKAVKLLEKSRFPSFIIDIYGEGPFEAELKKMVKDANLNSYIRFMGSSSRLHELYAFYDYLIQPSYGETFCFSIVESLASKLPVITTVNIGNVLGLIKEGKNGFLYNVEETVELKIILENLIHGKLTNQNSSYNNYSVENFSLEKMVSEHIKQLPCI